MNDIIKEAVCDCLDKIYCQMEDMMMEHDITKDGFSDLEDKLSSIAEFVGLSSVFYPFKK